ncbi:ABC transporter permease [Terriglobus saanensis]|uniref:Permease n=1 Tax=Terriglobus saanensis (strain ATCC BAA-1853 / DSM 23119 / SP1PR4) TaxID=401053 RepID=E8UXD3_TERSS|nr:ABC transporter permease [Terriglobus saanensis]ADV84157.1 permease [Terriglobus saanensis SP1PR4]
MSTLTQDVRYALRQLRKTPAFTITAILTLALGIGANAAIFTLVHAVLLQSLPVAEPSRLIRIGSKITCCVNSGAPDDGDNILFSTQTYQQLKQGVPEFEELAAIQAGFAYRPVIARRDGAQAEARSSMGEFVSGNYFQTFGLNPQAGRLLTEADDIAGAPIVAVMSYDTWQNQFSGDTSIIGGTFWINTKAVTVAGIAPKGFYGDRLSSTPPNFYLPIESMPVLANVGYVHDPETHWLDIIGRVKPGVALGPLQQKVSAIVKQSIADNKDFIGDKGKALLAKTHVGLAPGGAGIEEMKDQYASNLRILMTISALVLLIACANIANLLLVRGMGRKTEMSVRTALGAMRRRIIGQLLTESLILALLSGFAGLAVAFAGTQMLLRMVFNGANRLPIQASPSPIVLGFALLLSLVTGVVFGIAPAWIAAQAQPADALRSGTRATSTGASLLQKGLVVLQAGLSLVLLVGAGLFSQNLAKLQHKDLKLESHNRYIVHINPQTAGYMAPQLEALYRTIEDRFHAVPGVKKVGISTYTPMEDNNWGNYLQVQGQPTHGIGASFVKTNAEYFASVGTHLLAGRGFTMRDTAAAPTVTIINQKLAQQLFQNSSPLGQHIGPPKSPGDYEIVGVVEDTAYTDVKWENHGMYFVPMMQRPASDTGPADKDEGLYAGAIVLQTERPMDNVEALARRTLASINPNLSVVKFQTFNAQIADRFTDDRTIARLTMLFGGLALLLASVGLYGVTSYTVARRTSEIGIRMALGAERASVVAMILRSAMLQAGIGLAIGIPVALFCVRYVKSQLYNISSVDPSVLAGAVVTLALAAGLAGLIPARRAASTDPAQALRME